MVETVHRRRVHLAVVAHPLHLPHLCLILINAIARFNYAFPFFFFLMGFIKEDWAVKALLGFYMGFTWRFIVV